MLAALGEHKNMPRKTIEDVANLLNRLEKVKVIRWSGNEDFVRIELTVASFESLLVLNHIAEAVNANFDSWAQHAPDSKEAKDDPARAIHYRISIQGEEAANGKVLEAIGYFGCHLVWQLSSKSKIEKNYANELLNNWGCCEISA